jgi:hypothetical protein
MIYVAGADAGDGARVRVILPARCCACGWPQCTGIISFGNKMHEPHCDACCKDWERLMLNTRSSVLNNLGLQYFRRWQAERKATA